MSKVILEGVTRKKNARTWQDERGNEIPLNRITEMEKIKEQFVNQLFKDSAELHIKLKDLKERFNQQCFEILQLTAAENSIDLSKVKGNQTIYNFDRSIKIEVNINDQIAFDSALIDGCKTKLFTFLDKSVSASNKFIKDLVMDAFGTASGKLDTRKVLSLLKYKSRINDSVFNEAMELLEKSISRPDSKKYFRIWKKDESGEYQNIDLNFSSIQL